MARHSFSGRPTSPLLSRGSGSAHTGSPLLPTTARALSIRAPAHIPPAPGSPYSTSRFRPRGRRSLLIALSLAVGFWLWRKSGAWGKPDGLSAEEQERCRLFPWMAKCIGGEWGNHDPFEFLHFEKEGGHMFYPAHSASEEETAVPPNQPHPIHLLISDAKRDWSKKIARQSKTDRKSVV